MNDPLNHEIIIHVNNGTDGTLEYLNSLKIKHTYTNKNVGICEGVNLASQKSTMEYILYAHDDFYFCPNWDEILKKEIDKIGHKYFYLSGTMMNNGQIPFNCGDKINNFDEKKFLNEYRNFNFYDFQGSTWAPHLIHKDIWNKVGGFSEEFNPGIGSDPDFNMKLWKSGVRIFKGLGDFKVYHFGSLTTRKNNKIKQNRGDVTFLKKWGISTRFFKKYYLKSKTVYKAPLNEPNKNIYFYLELILCKIKLTYLKIFII